jgi:hypothetical protein
MPDVYEFEESKPASDCSDSQVLNGKTRLESLLVKVRHATNSPLFPTPHHTIQPLPFIFCQEHIYNGVLLAPVDPNPENLGLHRLWFRKQCPCVTRTRETACSQGQRRLCSASFLGE